MPLEQGSSREAISHNVAIEREAGKPEKQAVAIAYSEAGKSREDADTAPVSCAGILFRAPGPRYLLVRRTDTGEWEQPGGHAEGDETPESAAERECIEEIGGCPEGPRWPVRRNPLPNGGGEYTCFLQDVPEPFEPKLNPEEHTAWQWAAADALPENMLAPVARTIELIAGNELDIAKRMASGYLLSPYKYEGAWLFDLRVTGTGTSYRKALDEYVYRPPEEFLTEEFRERCNGLPVLFMHAEGLLNTKEYRERNVGSVFYPYIAGDEVRGIAKIFDTDAVQCMLTDFESTSPAVIFRDAGSAVSVEVDGKTVLIEGNPSFLDHLAICPVGVWDKGKEPSGINTGETQMDENEVQEQVPAWADALGKRLDAMCSRMDALENKGGDAAPTHELKAVDSAEHAAEREGDREMGLEKKAEGEIAAAIKEGETEHRSEERADSARLDSEEKERKEKEEQMRKDSEEKLRADAQLRADNADMKKQIEAMNARLQALTTPLSPSDRDQLSAAQARWDSVAQMFGDSVPAPLHGESPLAYRQRLATKYQKHSPSFKGIRFDSLDSDSFMAVEEQIRKDAQTYAKSPAVSPTGKLIPIIRRDEAGRQITEYSGDMDSWLGHFKHQGHGVRLLDPRQKH